MVQRGEDLRFALEARQPIGVGCERRGEDLDRDLTLQLRVRRAIDLPHSTHAELRGDFVDAEAGAGREGQAIFVDYTGGTAERTGLLLPDGRTLSGVTRRATHASSPHLDRRVTFDRAVWTKPLASAADAAPQLCAFNRGSPGRRDVHLHDGGLIATSTMRRQSSTRRVGSSIVAVGHTSGARASERDGERVAGHGRGLRGVIKDVCQERFNEELSRG